MKTLTILASLLSFSLWLPISTTANACPGADKSRKSRVVPIPKSAQNVILALKGMSCGGCADRIASELRKIEGVYTANVSYTKSRAVIHYAPKKISVIKLVEVIEKLGFKVNIGVS